ncbi:MAG: hypothetical protein WBP12_04610 [Candidatus Saccharimonas sp.]
MPDNDVITLIPPGYSEEDTTERHSAKRYEPRSSMRHPITTDTLDWRLKVLSPEWWSAITTAIITRYREGFAYCRIRYEGLAKTDTHLPEIQDRLRSLYDFPGKFGTTHYKVRVEPTCSSSVIILHVPLPDLTRLC